MKDAWREGSGPLLHPLITLGQRLHPWIMLALPFFSDPWREAKNSTAHTRSSFHKILMTPPIAYWVYIFGHPTQHKFLSYSFYAWSACVQILAGPVIPSLFATLQAANPWWEIRLSLPSVWTSSFFSWYCITLGKLLNLCRLGKIVIIIFHSQEAVPGMMG